MPFVVDDFHSLVELLTQHPEWRAELRRHVLSDDLIELPSMVRQLAEAETRTESRLHVLAETQDRADTSLERVEDRLQSVESRLERLETVVREQTLAQSRTETRLALLKEQFSSLEDDALELHYVRRGPAYLGPIARHLRIVAAGALADLLDDAVDAGRLTEDQRDAIRMTDLVMAGRRRQDGRDIYLVVEIAGRIAVSDIERSVERAALLQRLGRPAVPVVAGRQIDAAVAELAYKHGVWYVLGGRVTAPRST